MKTFLGLRRPIIFEILGVFGVWLVAAWPFLNPSTSVYGFDTLAYTGPNLTHVFESWRHFSIPLWQDAMFGGVPFLGRLGAQGLYLPHLPLAYIDLNVALDLGASLHLLLLAIGMFALVRWALKMPEWSGFVATTSVLGSSYVAVKMLSYDQLVALAWLPWLLLCVEFSVRMEKRLALAGPLAVVSSLLVLGGHPQYIYLEAIIALFYAILRILESRAWRAMLTLGLGGLLAGGISSLQLGATYFLSQSSGIPSQRPLASLANPAFILPPSRIPIGVLGDPLSTAPALVTGSGEAVLGLGLPICLLALVGLCFGTRLGLLSRSGFFLLSIIGTSLSVGPRWSLFRFLYDTVPGFGGARVAGRWFILPLFFLAVLGAEGVSVLTAKARKNYSATTTGLVVVVSYLLIMLGPFETPSTELLVWWLIATATFILCLVLTSSKLKSFCSHLWLLVFVLVGTVIPLLNTPATNSTRSTRFADIPKPLVDQIKQEGGRVFAQTFDMFDEPDYLIANLRPNTGLLSGVSTVDGYDGGQWVQQRWISQAESLTNGPFSTDLNIRSQTRFPLDASLMRRFGVRWALVDSSVLPASQQLLGFSGPRHLSGKIELWENPLWLGSAIAYLNSELRKPDVAAQFRSISTDVAVVESTDSVVTCEGDCPAQGVSVLYQEVDRAGFVFEIASDGVLAFDQGWSPDWTAYVDGIRRETFPINANQVGVKFSAGFHRIEFRYDPVWVDPLVVLSLASGLLALALSAQFFKAKGRKRLGSSVGDAPPTLEQAHFS